MQNRLIKDGKTIKPMKKTFLIIIATVILISSCSSTQNSLKQKNLDIMITKISKEHLIGCWNEHPVWFAGAGDSHWFFDDGRYRFGFNEMDELKRVEDREGTWKIENNKVVVTIKSQNHLEDGIIVWDDSFGYMREGFECKTEMIVPPLILTYELADLRYDFNVDSEYFQGKNQGKYLTAMFGKKQYWKIRDPKDPYGKQLWEYYQSEYAKPINERWKDD